MNRRPHDRRESPQFSGCLAPEPRVFADRITGISGGPEAAGYRTEVIDTLVYLSRWSEQPPLRFPKSRRVVFDIAILEGMSDLRGPIAPVFGIERIVFGSHSPMFYFEAAALNLREAALTDEEARAVLNEHARGLLTPP